MEKTTFMHPYSPLKIVDGRVPCWGKEALAEANSRRNFIVILQRPEELDDLCASLGCLPTLPEKLERWGIHALADVLEAKDYQLLLSLYRSCDLRLIEQLKITRNQPPRVKPFILYCEVRGIISDHCSLEEAGETLLDYLDSFKRAKIFPLAGIYEFKNEEWSRVRKLF
jgi:hypothetical protein